MSKFPNHGLFTRTAAASSRSTSFIASVRRGAPRRRSAAITPASSLALSTNQITTSASSNLSTSSPSSSQQPFIGPLTLAASQNASAVSSTSVGPSVLDFDSDFASTSTLTLTDLSSHLAHPATLSAAARHLARSSTTTSAFPLSSFDRIPAHRNPPLYSIPNTRGVHIFYPNAAASHALSSLAGPSFEASTDVVGIETSGLPVNSALADPQDAASISAGYVPLWNASNNSGLSHSYSQRRIDSISLYSPEPSSPDLLRSPSFHVPINLLGNSSPTTDAHFGGLSDVHASIPPPFASSSTEGAGTITWNPSDTSSSAWQSTYSSKSSKSSHSSSSSSSSRPPTPTVSARPNLATSTAQQDSTGTHGSGSSTPTQNTILSPYQIESALLGPNSILTTAARGNYDQRRSASAAAAADSSDVADSPPLWPGAFASPKHRKLHYAFEHGAYGIPKRHPWAAVRGNGKRVQAAARSGAYGMLAAAADFLTGSASASGPAAAKEKLGGDAIVGEDGRRLGLNSPIREHGRIVQDRLQSVQVGEDAYFLRPDSIGVADGVGGWASRAGADPALFSRLLMHFCAAELSKFDGLSADELAAQGGKKLREWEQLDPVEVMHVAWERCVRASRREGILGSSTALLAVLRGDELRIANLGDCVLLIIRAGELLFRSTEQQHSFNFPVQLGMMGHTAESVTIAANRTLNRDGFLQSGASDDLDDNAPNPLGTSTPASMDEARKGRPGAAAASDGDDAEEAEWDEPRRDAGRWAVKVQKGDIIIVGSDGLVDNLFDEDIVEEVLRFAPPPTSHQSIPDPDAVSPEDGDRPTEGQDEYRLPDDFCPQLVSEALCSRAKAVSEDSRAVSSPFQQRAMEEGLHYVGGKHDDISVVVAVVGDPSERLSRAGSSIGSKQEVDPAGPPSTAHHPTSISV